MRYALDRLDEIIIYELNPLSDAMVKLKTEDVNTHAEKIKNETSSIRQFLWNSLEEIKDKEQLKILAFQYQSSIDYLIDQVRLYKSTTKNNQPALKSLYEKLELHLSETFAYIQRHFSIWIIPECRTRDQYLHTSLNEQEMTILLCAFVDLGVISNHTYTSLLELAAPVLATRHKKGLIAASMLKSKDKLTADMKKKIKDLLLGMARQVDQY